MTATKKTDPYYQAQDILSRREHSAAEMRQKMTKKGFTTAQIEEVIAWLQDKKLLSDARFAASYVESTLRFNGVGPRWIKQKLHQRGVAPAVVEQALTAALVATPEVDLVAQAAVRWQTAHPARSTDAVRLTRFLLGRGFSPNLVQDYMARLRTATTN